MNTYIRHMWRIHLMLFIKTNFFLLDFHPGGLLHFRRQRACCRGWEGWGLAVGRSRVCSRAGRKKTVEWREGDVAGG